MVKPEIEIWFEAETRCNLACKFCYNYWKAGRVSAPERISTKQTLAALARIFANFSCPKMTISGGEPLLREDLLEIIRFVVGHGVMVVVTTNGTLLSEENVPSLIEAGVTTFEVSLHSIDSSMHNQLSGQECWHRTIEGILRLRAASANIVPVFVATSKNLGHFRGVVKMLGMIGIREFIFNGFIPAGLGVLYEHEIGVPDSVALVSCLAEANTIAESFDATIHLGNPIEITEAERRRLTRVEMSSCPVRLGQRRWTLDVAGNLRRCNQLGASIGNVFSDGIDRIIREMNGTREAFEASSIQPCKILASSLVTMDNAPIASI